MDIKDEILELEIKLCTLRAELAYSENKLDQAQSLYKRVAFLVKRRSKEMVVSMEWNKLEMRL